MESFLSQTECKSLFGYYVGLGSDSALKNARGFLMNFNDNGETAMDWALFNSLFEIFFTAPEPSLDKYKLDDNGNLSFEYKKIEFDDKDIKKIRQLQDGALLFVKEFGDFNRNIGIKINSSLAFANLRKIGMQPGYKDTVTIGNMHYNDGTLINICKPKSKLSYMLKPGCFYADFAASDWKVGFLKRFCPMFGNYGEICKILYKMSH
jgi:hypothetical protein